MNVFRARLALMLVLTHRRSHACELQRVLPLQLAVGEDLVAGRQQRFEHPLVTMRGPILLDQCIAYLAVLTERDRVRVRVGGDEPQWREPPSRPSSHRGVPRGAAPPTT